MKVPTPAMAAGLGNEGVLHDTHYLTQMRQDKVVKPSPWLQL